MFDFPQPDAPAQPSCVSPRPTAPQATRRRRQRPIRSSLTGERIFHSLRQSASATDCPFCHLTCVRFKKYLYAASSTWGCYHFQTKSSLPFLHCLLILFHVQDTQSKIMPQSLRFNKNKFGKPQLDWQHEDGWIPPYLHFNISHTSSLVACGVTVDFQVGIDVEDKKRKLKHDVLSLARRFFSPNEVEFLHGLSDPVILQQEFIKLWTLKEAYVKALGRGFSAAPFRNFTVRHQASRIAVEAHSDSENLTENWQFALLELSSHYAAICIEKADEKEGDGNDSLKLKVWKTIPFVEDECILDTDTVVPISGAMWPRLS